MGFEFWQNIPDYEELYQASTYGRIKSKSNGVIKIANVHKGGYLRLGLFKGNKEKKYLVHRLIAATFLLKPNIPSDCAERIEINHKDQNPSDNRVENLEWCTQSYNLHYGNGYERRAKSATNNPLQSKCVYQYDKSGNFIDKFPSLSEVERAKGFDQGFISKCCNGKLSQAYGYIWKYA